MHNHFDRNLGVKNLILLLKPKVLIECGAGGGENTVQLLSLMDEYSFSLTVVSDGERSPDEEFQIYADRHGVNLNGHLKELVWIRGVSYIELKTFCDNSVDFVLIDTDHNYWTLREELNALTSKLKVGGVVVMHDTETYGHNSGRGNAYHCGVAYPGDEIAICEREGLGMRDAILEILSTGNYFKLAETKESHGATVLLKVRNV